MTTADTTRLAIAKLTGTPPALPATPAWQLARFTGESVNFTPTTVNSSELDPSGQVRDSILTGGSTAGAVNFEVSRNPFLEDLLAAVFRNDWGVGTEGEPPVAIGADELIPGTSLSSWAIEKRFQVGDAPASYTFHRFMPSGVDTLEITIAPGDPISGNANFNGGVQSLDTAEVAGATYDDSGDNPVMTAPLVTELSIDTGTVSTRCLSAFGMTFNSNLRAVECIGTLGPRELLLGVFSAELSGTVYYTDDTIIQKFIDQTPFPVIVKITDSEGNAYEFEFPRCKAASAPVNAGGTGQDVVIDLTMAATYDTTKGYTVKVTRSGGVGTATGATAGTPGTFAPPGAIPANLAALNTLGALGNTTAWTTGQNVVLGDASLAHWNATTWVVGAAP